MIVIKTLVHRARWHCSYTSARWPHPGTGLPFSASAVHLWLNSFLLACFVCLFVSLFCHGEGPGRDPLHGWVFLSVFPQWWKWCWKDSGCQIYHELHLQSVWRRAQGPGEFGSGPLVRSCIMQNWSPPLLFKNIFPHRKDTGSLTKRLEICKETAGEGDTSYRMSSYKSIKSSKIRKGNK